MEEKCGSVFSFRGEPLLATRGGISAPGLVAMAMGVDLVPILPWNGDGGGSGPG